jgi:hypothetical protein
MSAFSWYKCVLSWRVNTISFSRIDLTPFKSGCTFSSEMACFRRLTWAKLFK